MPSQLESIPSATISSPSGFTSALSSSQSPAGASAAETGGLGVLVVGRRRSRCLSAVAVGVDAVTDFFSRGPSSSSLQSSPAKPEASPGSSHSIETTDIPLSAHRHHRRRGTVPCRRSLGRGHPRCPRLRGRWGIRVVTVVCGATAAAPRPSSLASMVDTAARRRELHARAVDAVRSPWRRGRRTTRCPSRCRVGLEALAGSSQ